MATIETSIDVDRQLTIQTVVGDVTAEEIASTIETYYEGVCTTFILWDFSKASLSQITPNQVKDLVTLTSRYSSRRPGGKTAAVFESDFGFGMGRMFELIQDSPGATIAHASFRSKKLALEWLFE